MNNNPDTTSLPMMALDQVPTPNANAQQINALVKKQGRLWGYRLADGRIVSKEEGVALARQGGILGVGIAHRKDTQYLKSLPDQSEGNNLGNLPSITAAGNQR